MCTTLFLILLLQDLGRWRTASMGVKHRGTKISSSSKCTFPLAIREDAFLNSQHRKAACPQAAKCKIPHGVSCLSRSTLNGLSSPASKSSPSAQALPTLPGFFPSLHAEQLFHTVYYAACLITAHSITPVFWISDITFHCHAAVAIASFLHISTAQMSK